MNDESLRAELDAVYSSTSWRLTAPLRQLSKLINNLRTSQLKVNKGLNENLITTIDVDKAVDSSCYKKKFLTQNAQNYLNEFKWYQRQK